MINITCTGSQGCFDRNSNIVEKAIKLQGANDGVLSFMKDDDSSIKITQVIVGAFYLRKKTGNFGGSKSGISDW